MQRLASRAITAKQAAPLTGCDQHCSLAFMDVLPADVKRYGSSAAIVLATLREQGCSATVTVAVTIAEISRLCGLQRDSVSRALVTLRKRDAVRVGRYKRLGRTVIRTTDAVQECSVPREVAADCTTHGDVEVLPRPTALRRLDSLRSLLELAR